MRYLYVKMLILCVLKKKLQECARWQPDAKYITE